MVGRGYFAHFKLQTMKGGVKHVLKRLHPLQNVGNLLQFPPQLTESRHILLYSQN